MMKLNRFFLPFLWLLLSIIILFYLVVFSLYIPYCKDKSTSLSNPKIQEINSEPINVSHNITNLRELVKKDPSNLVAWIKLGNLLMDSGQFKEAVSTYERVLTLSPENVDVRVDMGTCYRNLGDSERAGKEYRRALKYNPEHFLAHKNLGVVLAYDLGKTKEAIAEFKTYLNLSPGAPDSQQIKQAIKELQERV